MPTPAVAVSFYTQVSERARALSRSKRTEAPPSLIFIILFLHRATVFSLMSVHQARLCVPLPYDGEAEAAPKAHCTWAVRMRSEISCFGGESACFLMMGWLGGMESPGGTI